MSGKRMWHFVEASNVALHSRVDLENAVLPAGALANTAVALWSMRLQYFFFWCIVGGEQKTNKRVVDQINPELFPRCKNDQTEAFVLWCPCKKAQLAGNHCV